jgi:hypothetical protein
MPCFWATSAQPPPRRRSLQAADIHYGFVTAERELASIPKIDRHRPVPTSRVQYNVRPTFTFPRPPTRRGGVLLPLLEHGDGARLLSFSRPRHFGCAPSSSFLVPSVEHFGSVAVGSILAPRLRPRGKVSTRRLQLEEPCAGHGACTCLRAAADLVDHAYPGPAAIRYPRPPASAVVYTLIASASRPAMPSGGMQLARCRHDLRAGEPGRIATCPGSIS